MLSRVQLCSAACRIALMTSLKRNIGVSAACYQKTTATGSLDPIQKLFIDKVHEYVQKSKTAGGKLVDASPLTEKALKDELEKIARQYGLLEPTSKSFLHSTSLMLPWNQWEFRLKLNKSLRSLKKLEKKKKMTNHSMSNKFNFTKLSCAFSILLQNSEPSYLIVYFK